ncbi:TlpA disulfide reductase family protein [Nonlabens xiamenensis]|uniref:TlpA disulfide reductase family protein n=1 Tax=Nonlabens xiamenensis TaxID=2341043 RepID=UPI000F609EE2|nr:TlpA disulfide reductase family protein [Nonlabens xiamenensis]
MKYIIALLSVLVINSCQDKTTETSYLISGEAPGVANGLRLYLNKLDENRKTVVLDTSIVMDENFHFDSAPRTENEELRFITLDGSNSNLILLTANEPIRLTIEKDSLHYSRIEGSPSSSALQAFKRKQAEYMKRVNEFNQERIQAMKSKENNKVMAASAKWQAAEEHFVEKSMEMIKANQQNLVSIMILGELLNAKIMDATEARVQFDEVNPTIQNTSLGQNVNEFLKKSESVAVGSKAPYFEGKNPEGNILKLPEVLGKVTLIDFWASWCGPCRRENPNVVAAYEKYHDKGFNIISVSLDRPNNESAWKQAIEKDKMTWNHISRLQYFGPIAKLYNVSAIPATFLLDEDGVIIDTNLRGQALHERLEELLGDAKKS